MELRTRWNISRFLITTMYLLGGWILFTWSLAPRTVLIGFAHSLIVAAITFRLFIEEDEAGRWTLLPRPTFLVVYLVVLVFQMYVASFRVLWQVLRGRINPGVVHFRTRLRSDIARVVLTSSITLTPGTITLLIDDDHLLVHWLDTRTTHSGYAFRMIALPFERLLRRIWV